MKRALLLAACACVDAELPPGGLEFQVDRQGRPVPIRR